MSKFEKGWIYLIQLEGDDRWYIAQQFSQKTWIFSQFTHVITRGDLWFSANSIALYEKVMSYGVRKCVKFNTNSEMRRAMFNILKYGRIEDESNSQ